MASLCFAVLVLPCAEPDIATVFDKYGFCGEIGETLVSRRLFREEGVYARASNAITFGRQLRLAGAAEAAEPQCLAYVPGVELLTSLLARPMKHYFDFKTKLAYSS